MPTCLLCFRANVSCVPTCLACLHANVPCVISCSCAKLLTYLTCWQKYVFSDMFHLDFWYFFFVFFSCEIKLYMKSARKAGMSLETFILRIQWHIPAFFLPNGSFYRVLWPTFCNKMVWFLFGITLRVIFKWLINGGRCIITRRRYLK